MKAVVFTDTFQSIVMFSGLVLTIVLGINKVGGIEIIYQRLKEGQRLEFFDFNSSLFVRHTFWSIMIGGFFTSLTVYGSNQATIQRYLTLPSVRDAQIAMMINLLGTFSILVICCVCGFVAYANYFGCDPLLSNKISNYDQLLPFFVVDLFKNFHGLSGIFIACIYSAALSTISSGLNSLSAVFLHDFIYPTYTFYKLKNLSHQRSIITTNFLAGFFGIITMCLAFLCKYVGSTVLQLSLSIFGLLGGPLLGVMMLGMLVPFANSIGATAGLLISTGFNFWLGLSSILYGTKPVSKNFDVNLCFDNSTTSVNFRNETFGVISSNEGFRKIYDLSYYWYSLLAVLNVFIIGITVSIITNTFNKNKTDPDPDLLVFRGHNYRKRINNDSINEKVKMIDL